MKIWNAFAGKLSKNLPIAILLAIVFSGGFLLGERNSIISAQTNTPSNIAILSPLLEVYDMIHNEYMDYSGEGINDDALLDGAISGMMGALGDQYSNYMTPADYSMQNSDLSGEFEGIGAVIRTLEEENAVTIVSLLPGSPAEAAGLRPGDIFVEVDGENVLGINQSLLAFKVRGPKGTAVDLTIRRDEELINFTIVRDSVKIINIETDLLADDQVAYIKLFQFTHEARNELNAALEALDANNRQGVILDLRSNPGGLLTSAIDIGSAFIPKGDPILIEEFGGDRGDIVFRATGDTSDLQVPVVLLIDENSASASELIAGALQDYGLATLIGETTFGKGTVQSWRGISNGGGISLTVARWLTPNGNWIQDQGVTPDIVVEWTPDPELEDEFDPQLAAALEFFEVVPSAEPQ